MARNFGFSYRRPLTRFGGGAAIGGGSIHGLIAGGAAIAAGRITKPQTKAEWKAQQPKIQYAPGTNASSARAALSGGAASRSSAAKKAWATRRGRK